MRLDPLPKKQKDVTTTHAVFSAGVRVGQGPPAEMTVLFNNECSAHKGSVDLRESQEDGTWKIIRRRQHVEVSKSRVKEE